MPHISIVLPCQNEKEALPGVLKTIQYTIKKHNLDAEIIVSDSSTDGSDKIATQYGTKLVKHDKQGYGIALREGMDASNAEIVAFADCDGTYDFAELPKLLKKLKKNTIVLGSRKQGRIERGAMPFLHRYLGTPIINLVLKLFLGVNTSDSQSGFRVMHKETYERLELKTTGMEFASEILIKAQKKKLR
jgi:glycosyltransferase involved in cell wall biosynthesis